MRAVIPDYDLADPPDLAAALHLLAAGEGWRPIAGGTDLMVLFNAGRLPFLRLVNVRRLPEIRGIHVSDTELALGAAVTYTELRRHPLIQSEFPLLAAAASWTGGIANQNRGTLGGNIANASPAADSAPVLLAYDAVLDLQSIHGTRSVSYRDFHTGYKQMELRPEELIATIRLPRVPYPLRHHSRKVGARKAQAISKISIAAVADFKSGVIRDFRLALASVAPIPLRCLRTEDVLRGQSLSPSLIASARESLLGEIQPISDIRSTAEYRAQVSANLLTVFLEDLRTQGAAE